ncbi:hypothetical protein GCM10009738_20720 [Kitasatospora viridis]
MASSASSPERRFTFTPVRFWKSAASALVVCSCWPLYTVIDWPANDWPLADEALGLDPPELPHAVSARQETDRTASAAVVRAVANTVGSLRIVRHLSEGERWCRRFPGRAGGPRVCGPAAQDSRTGKACLTTGGRAC